MRRSRISITHETEDATHIAILDYLRAVLPKSWIVVHVPNKPRSKIAGAREKRMGATKGWPDLMIFGEERLTVEPLRPVVYLIEVKTSRGVVRSSQNEVHDRLRALGFKVGVARSIDDARHLCLSWRLPIKESCALLQRSAA